MKSPAHRTVFPVHAILSAKNALRHTKGLIPTTVSLLSVQVCIHFLHSTLLPYCYVLNAVTFIITQLHKSIDLFYIKYYTWHMSTCINLFMNSERERRIEWEKKKRVLLHQVWGGSNCFYFIFWLFPRSPLSDLTNICISKGNIFSLTLHKYLNNT